MPNHHLGSLSPDGAQITTVFDDIRVEDIRIEDLARSDVTHASADRDQLERDIAAIECASAALRRAEPALQSWAETPATTMRKPRPVWLLIGALWLSTALVTLGAAFAISALVG